MSCAGLQSSTSPGDGDHPFGTKYWSTPCFNRCEGSTRQWISLPYSVHLVKNQTVRVHAANVSRFSHNLVLFIDPAHCGVGQEDGIKFLIIELHECCVDSHDDVAVPPVVDCLDWYFEEGNTSLSNLDGELTRPRLDDSQSESGRIPALPSPE